MRFNASLDSCASEVLLPGRGGVASVVGVVVFGSALALGCVALLFARLRRRRTPCAGVCVPRVQECERRSVSDSSAALDSPCAEGHEPQQTRSRDVAEFALKARVVYPINQRFRVVLASGGDVQCVQYKPIITPGSTLRPLADGSSNPSLRERTHPAPPSRDSASSLADDWPSQDRDDDESSVCVSCDPSPETHAFRRVQHYAQTPSHSRLSLLSLTLQELQTHTTQLQQHKYKMFLQVVRVLGVELLLKGVSVSEGVELGVEPVLGAESCSVEEVEKTGREQLEHSLQTAVCFAQQLCVLGQDGCVSDAVMRGVIGALCVLEEALTELQAALQKMLLDRLLCWQEVCDCLRERTALLQREAELLLDGQSQEPLRCDGQTVGALEAEVRATLDACADETRRETDGVVRSRCLKACARRRRMMKTQSAEMHNTHAHTDALLMMKASAELLVNHWHQRTEFDLQQDLRIIEALCERWTAVFSRSSRRLADLGGEVVLGHIGSGPAPSAGPAPSPGLWTHTHARLQERREQQQRSTQECVEDEAETHARLQHFAEQQRHIATATVARHAHMQISSALIEEQQQLLTLEFQRILSARGFYLRTVREMKLSVLTDTQSVGAELGVELGAAAELLQGHTHFMCGHALAHRTRLLSHTSRDRRAQERLLEAVCERVYVTRDSVSALIGEHHSRIHTILSSSQHLDTDTHTQMKVCSAALQTELIHWARTPTSTELQHRVVELKRRCVMEIQKSLQSPAHTHTQLTDEERSFRSRLASLARVSEPNDDHTGQRITRSAADEHT